MNKNLKSILISSILCLTLIVTSNACDKHNSNNIENHKNKKFDYSKITNNLSESVKKEVDNYYSKIDSEYDKLSGEAKKAVAKISQYK
jgi:outer membrane protein assembly factor BamD (BamD/ComL family)